jgi:agmatine deiminase
MSLILESDSRLLDARSLGFRMPAEFEPHQATWMAWPCRDEIWHPYIEEVKRDYARLARTIAGFETLIMLARPQDAEEARQICGPSAQVVVMPLDDSWTRDSGPTFLVDGRGGLRAAAFRFNAWGGKYHPHDKDAALGAAIAAHVGVPAETSTLALEGGGIFSDGEGTIVTTETCLLNPNRNPGLSKREVEAELKRMLGAEKIIWLPGDPEETETDGHIDGFMSFCAPGKAVVETAPGREHPRYGILKENRRALDLQTDAKGRFIEALPVEEADAVEGVGERYCRSYVNFYICNGAVIAPAYGIPSDRRVEAVLSRAFPNRTVVMLPIGRIAMGGGGFHCITQQQPRA